MFIRVDKKTVLDKISPCLCTISTRSANPSLSCLYLSANKDAGTLTVTSFDTFKGTKTVFNVEVLESGGVLIDAVQFNSIVRSLPEGSVTVSSDVNFLTVIAAGNAKFEIGGLNPNKFPAFPELAGDKKFEIGQGILKKMIQQVIFSAAVIDLKPVLTGVLFEARENNLRLCACDGYRIAIRDENCIRNLSVDSDFIVPAKSLQEVYKLLSDDEDTMIRIELARRHIIFMFEEFTFFSRYVDGDYIDYKKSFIKNLNTKVRVNLQSAIDCFERCALLISEKVKTPVKLVFENDSINVLCNTDFGKINESIPCEIEGESITIGFNNRFLTEALKGAANCGDEEVMLELNTPLSGMVIRSLDKDSYYYMVVPMRLN